MNDLIESFWDRQPCNVTHGLSVIGSKEYFDEVSEKRYFVEPHILSFAEFDQWVGKRVLEIGCGIGTDAAEFAKHGTNYIGIDISQKSIDLAKQRFDIFDLPGEFFKIDASDTKQILPLGTFDLIYSYGVIHHHPDSDKIINNVYDMLEPNGEFRFMVYAKNSWKYTMIRKGIDQFEAQKDCPYAECFTEENIRDMLGDKFIIDQLEQDHCFMYNVEKYKQGIYELDPWFKIMPDVMKEAIKEYLGWHLLIKARKV